MTGTLVKKNDEWYIKYDRAHEVLFYQLDENSKRWSNREGVKKFIHDGIEVDFSLITSGQYNEEQESILREFQAKILYINHETI
jgi:hypothetical protein